MGRFLLAILVAAALLTNATVRRYIQPYAHFALDPVYEWSTHDRVKEIARMIQTEVSSGRETPTGRTFGAFLEQRYPADEHPELDPWGEPYMLRSDHGALVVVSAGRDQEPDTPDDILSAPVTAQQ